MNTLLWCLIFAIWFCALALLEPLSIGWRNYRSYRNTQRKMKALAEWYAQHPCKPSLNAPWRDASDGRQHFKGGSL